MLKAQFITLTETKKTQISSLLDSLKKNNLHLMDYNSATRDGPCLIFCDDISTRELNFLIPLTKKHRCLIIQFHPPERYEQLAKVFSLGVSDILRDDNINQLAQTIKERLERWALLDRMICDAREKYLLIGDSEPWLQALRELVEAAHLSDAPILLQGETGTGKELLAHIAHDYNASGNQKNFVIIDATTLSPELSGSELFGHEKGAYTGAVSSRSGAVADAHNGTLFIDEIGELPLSVQANLLRLIQEGTYKHLGGNIWRHSKFRLISATHCDLVDMCKKGTFRTDLFYRIAGSVINLPPLRERGNDVLILARYFINAALNGPQTIELEGSLETNLISRDFSGNIRDLKQLARRIAMRHVGKGRITFGDLPRSERRKLIPQLNFFKASFYKIIQMAVKNGSSLKAISEMAKDAAITVAMEQNSDNLKDVADQLQISVRTLQMRRQRHH